MSHAKPTPSGDKVYLDTPYLSIRWESQASRMVVEWKAWATSAEFRAAYDAILVAVGENRASRLLIDLRKTRVLAEEDQQWLAENWVPRSVQAGLLSTALVLPERALPNLILENLNDHMPTGGIEISSFGTLEEATAWLAG